MQIAILIGALLASAPAQTGTPPEMLNSCVTAQLTDADRIVVTRWLFSALSAHPAVADMTKITAAQRETTTRQIVDLVTRLLTERCRPQALAALRGQGTSAFDAAMEAIGQSTMEALVSNPAVIAQMERFSGATNSVALRKLAIDAGIKADE